MLGLWLSFPCFSLNSFFMTIVLNSSSGNLLSVSLCHYVFPLPPVFLLFFFFLKYIPLASHFVDFFCLYEIRWNNCLPGLGDVSFCGSILVCRLHMPSGFGRRLGLKPAWVGTFPWIYWAITLATMSWSW